MERIKEAGARFISITDGIDTHSGIVADVFLTVLSSIATYERQLISERTRSSLKVLQDRGVQLGRPKKITSTLIRQVQTLHNDPSISVNDTCVSLGISRTSYYTALRQSEATADRRSRGLAGANDILTLAKSCQCEDTAISSRHAR